MPREFKIGDLVRLVRLTKNLEMRVDDDEQIGFMHRDCVVVSVFDRGCQMRLCDKRPGDPENGIVGGFDDEIELTVTQEIIDAQAV